MPTDPRRKRVLVSAYACEPNRGSEPDIGWQWVLAYQIHVNTWVLTRANNRHAISRYEDEFGKTGIRWIWVDAPGWVLRFKKKLGRPGILSYYWLWQFLAAKAAKAAEKEAGGFDWCHQLTMNGFREPGRLDFLRAPVVWGPIGGLQNSDWTLSRLRGLRPALMEFSRTVVNELTKVFGLRSIRAVKRRALVLGINQDSMQWIKHWRKGSIAQLIEIGLPKVPVKEGVVRSPRTILWAGNDESRKNPEFALLAWNELRKRGFNLELNMVGLSEKRQAELRAWSRKKGVDLDLGVSMYRWVSLDELATFYATAGQFWFTSYRDSSGTVLLWAGAYGLPSIAFNHQGASALLKGNRGALVDRDTIDKVLHDWCMASKALLDCSENPFCKDYSGEQYNWQNKVEYVMRIMNEINDVEHGKEQKSCPAAD